MPSTRPFPDRQLIRQQMRQRRRELSSTSRQQAANGALRKLIARREFRRARNIAIYLPVRGELPTTPLIRHCQQRNKRCFVPVVSPFTPSMTFVHYRLGHTLRRNAFGIGEPNPQRRRRAPSLDLVIMPLVAFDRQGNRLGMGGGYYDRCFAFRRRRGQKDRKPLLVGWAYSFQEVSRLPAAQWDVPLDAIVTEREWIAVKCPLAAKPS